MSEQEVLELEVLEALEVLSEEAGEVVIPKESDKFCVGVTLSFTLPMAEDVGNDIEVGLSDEKLDKLCQAVGENVGYAAQMFFGAREIDGVHVTILKIDEPIDNSEVIPE